MNHGGGVRAGGFLGHDLALLNGRPAAVVGFAGATRPWCRPAAGQAGPNNRPEEHAVEIWINPQCSKCRAALSILDEDGAEYTVRRYLDEPPTVQELGEVLTRLGLEPWDITRTGEATAENLGMATWERNAAARARWIEALADHPILIQRPIITADDDTAVIGRTEEAVRQAQERSAHGRGTHGLSPRARGVQGQTAQA
jgi:arsenate reductase (glutaredoxin)